jgi:60 kDa SS-A/Ro ribonucleoprotein
MTIRYADHVSRKKTPQSEPIPGEKQVKNYAGGYVYEVDKWQRLTRFLVLGSDGGTFYVKERALTRDNAQVVEACLAEDAARTICTIVEISDSGRAPKNDPAILALAIAASHEKLDVRTVALASLSKVCRIPTHLFHFIAYVKGMRGFGRQLRSAIATWYDRWDSNQLAFELVKYQSRDGWSNRDVFRLTHPKLSSEKQAILRWAVGADPTSREVSRRVTESSTAIRRYGEVGAFPDIISAYEKLKKNPDTNLAVQFIEKYGLTREMIPTELLNSVAVWNALLEKMPMTALVRNLAKMTSIGLLKPLSRQTSMVVARLQNPEYLKKGRIHPLAVLNAMRVYSSGHGDKGSLTWQPIGQIIDALDAAFYATFGNVTKTDKNLLLALDISGSMTSQIAGTGLSCREASAALALVTANVEPNHHIVGFTNGGYNSRQSMWGGYMRSGITPLEISPRQRLDAVVRYIAGLSFGGTDCALPMLYAEEQKLDVDAFCVYTDNETWAGKIHPSQALRSYRTKMKKPNSAQVVVGMTATEFTIADPKDPRTLDVVGFDLATPEAIASFIGG